MWTEWQIAISEKVLDLVGDLIDDQYYIFYVPKTAQFPYVSTGDSTASIPKHTLGGGDATEDFLWNFSIWCDLSSGGPSKVSEIGKALMEGLERALLTIDDHNHVGMLRIFETPVLQDPDNEQIFVQVLRYRIMVTKQ